VRTLHANRMPYFIAHSASGVLGLQLALAAGLGISCLNASAIPAGMRRMDPSADCPLPDFARCRVQLVRAPEKADALVEGTLSVLRAAFAGDASSTTAQTSPNWT
jgi:transcriptional regulator, LysR family